MRTRSFLTTILRLKEYNPLINLLVELNLSTFAHTLSVATAADAITFISLDSIEKPGISGEGTGHSGALADGTLGFSIPGSLSSENGDVEGAGKYPIFEFYDLLRISNQGPHPVQVFSEYDGDALADITFVDDDKLLRNSPPNIDVGEGVEPGLNIDSHNPQIGNFNEKLNIIAEVPSR